MIKEEFIKQFADQDEPNILKKLNEAIQKNQLFTQMIQLDRSIKAFGYTLNHIPRITFDRIKEVTGYDISSKDYSNLLLGASRSLELRLLLSDIFRYMFMLYKPVTQDIENFQKMFPNAELNIRLEENGNILSLIPLSNIYPWDESKEGGNLNYVRSIFSLEKIKLVNIANTCTGFHLSKSDPANRGKDVYTINFNFTSQQIQTFYNIITEKSPEYKAIENMSTAELVVLNWKCECITLSFLHVCSRHPILKVCLENRVYTTSQIKFKQDETFKLNFNTGESKHE